MYTILLLYNLDVHFGLNNNKLILKMPFVPGFVPTTSTVTCQVLSDRYWYVIKRSRSESIDL